jgi:hypothetical protein
MAAFFSAFAGYAGAAVDKPAPQAGPVGAFIDKMIEAYGGRDNLAKLNSYVSIWEMDAVARAESGRATNYVELPNKLRVELEYPAKREARVLNSGSGYKTYDDSPAEPADGPRLDSMKLQLIRLYTPLVLSNILAFAPDAITLSEDGGYSLLTLTAGRLSAIYFVNPASLMIEKVITRLDMSGQIMEFITEYSDIRPEGGVLMHHMENKFAGGVNTAKLYLREIRLSEKHDARVFDLTGGRP